MLPSILTVNTSLSFGKSANRGFFFIEDENADQIWFSGIRGTSKFS